MSKRHDWITEARHGGLLALALYLAATGFAQQPAAPSAKDQPAPPPATARITAEQAGKLFATVDELTAFAAQETGLSIKSPVKGELTTREAVQSYVQRKFDEDESGKRLQRDEIVLKKFGLLDRDFALRPFLLALLTEQVEAYYDPLTKSVHLLDWVAMDEQKTVLAHELTHALQDQRVDLEKWDNQTPLDTSQNVAQDVSALAKDEMDTAREAVTEGQAVSVMTDYALKPYGKSLLKNPEVLEQIQQQQEAATSDSPVLARAPLLLSEILMFPYRDGASFVQDVWMDKGQAAAFAGTLDRPPTSTWEIYNPREYEQNHSPNIPLLPNIHPLVDKLYTPYELGQMGQLDVHILNGVLGGESAASGLTPAWNGGIYWVGQRKSARTEAERASTASISLFYLSEWRNAAAARAFARLYADGLGRKYSALKHDLANEDAASLPPGTIEQVYSTAEGPVVLTIRGKLVFVSESFDLPLARKLAELLLDAQGVGETRMAQTADAPGPESETRASASAGTSRAASLPLTAGLFRFFSGCGVMRAAVLQVLQAAK